MERVFKFGGALMKNANGIRKVATIIEEFSCEPLVVVVSALGKTTNDLENLLNFFNLKNKKSAEELFFKIKTNHIEIINALFDEKANKLISKLEDLFRDLWDDINIEYSNNYFAYDQVVSYGEQFASSIVTAYLQEKNIATKNIDARKIIVTNSNFTNAAINWKYTEKTIKTLITPCLNNKYVVLTQGFCGADLKGNFTTLGREGSDFTAAILANILNVNEVTIWKDVPGLMNADPKRFKNTLKLDKISYHEAIELAFYGASVIHPKTIQPLKEKNIILNVKSFNNPASSPSVISNDISDDELLHKIIVKDNQVLLSITSKNLDFISEEKLTNIFKTFSNNKIHVNMMQNSAVSFSVCFNHNSSQLESVIKALENKFILRYNLELQLITIRHYSDEIIKKLTSNKKIFLEQKSRSTIQLLVR